MGEYKPWSQCSDDEKLGIAFSNYKLAILIRDDKGERKWLAIMAREVRKQRDLANQQKLPIIS